MTCRCRIGNDTVARAMRLAAALDRATAGDKQQRVFLRADRAVDYGELMDVMNLLRGAGYLEDRAGRPGDVSRRCRRGYTTVRRPRRMSVQAEPGLRPDAASSAAKSCCGRRRRSWRCRACRNRLAGLPMGHRRAALTDEVLAAIMIDPGARDHSAGIGSVRHTRHDRQRRCGSGR